MGLWSNIGSKLAAGFKAGKKFISDNAGTIANIGLTAVNPIAGAGMALARSKIGKQLWNQAKDLASKHAGTIGNLAGTALNAAAPALDALGSKYGVPIGTAIQSGAKKLAKHYAKDDTGWGRFAKGFANTSSKSNLSSQLNSQSNATNESNGHVAAGYTVSSTGNYNGLNRKKSWFQG